jgi:hypothetical protein
MGAGAAAGTAAAAAIKNIPGTPMQKIAIASGTAAAVAAGTKAGLDAGKAFSENFNYSSAIKNLPHSNPQIDRIPSPDMDMIRSVLEPSEIRSSFTDTHIPLETLLTSQLTFNLLILVLIFLLFIILFNNYILKTLTKFLKIIVEKYVSFSFW